MKVKSHISFRNLNNESFGIIFCAASFAWPLILPLIKPRDMTKEFQQRAIQLHGTFHGLKITNWYTVMWAQITKKYKK